MWCSIALPIFIQFYTIWKAVYNYKLNILIRFEKSKYVLCYREDVIKTNMHIDVTLAEYMLKFLCKLLGLHCGIFKRHCIVHNMWSFLYETKLNLMFIKWAYTHLAISLEHTNNLSDVKYSANKINDLSFSNRMLINVFIRIHLFDEMNRSTISADISTLPL